MRAFGNGAATLLCLMLAACGDGTGSGTAAPTPSATPTPTPTPSSTTYPAAFDFTRDRSFSGLVTASTTQTVPSRLVYADFDSGTIGYAAATQALSAFGMTITPNAAGATLSRSDSTLTYTYTIGTSAASLTIHRASAQTLYVSYIRDDEMVKPLPITRFALIGAPTLPAEVPQATTTYQLTATEIGTAPAGQMLVVDNGGKRVTGTVSVVPTGTAAAISIVLQGTIDAATGRFDGTASTTDGAYSGVFHGRLYGPAGVELGLIFDLVDRSGTDAAGVIVGRA